MCLFYFWFINNLEIFVYKYIYNSDYFLIKFRYIYYCRYMYMYINIFINNFLMLYKLYKLKDVF